MRKPMNGGSMGSIITGVIMVLVIIIILYYVYQWLYNSTAGQASSVDITQGNMYPFDNNPNYKAAPSNVSTYTIKGVADGGVYTANMWVYVTDTRGFASAANTPLASLLQLGNMLFIGLNPLNGGVVVRQANQADSTLNIPDIVANYNNPSSSYSANDRCDIINGIEYQRWIMITVVGNGKIVDIYIDGKLARSCVYKGPWSSGATNSAVVATIGQNNSNKLKGFFSGVRFDFGDPITPDAIWRLYQAGPTTASLWQQIKNFFGFKTVPPPDPCALCASASSPGPAPGTC